MDTVVFQFIASLVADADLRALRPDICAQAKQLIVDDLILKQMNINIANANQPTAHC